MVRAAAQGCLEAAEALIEDHYEALYAFLRRHVGNNAEAEDLTQRTFARIWQALPRFAGRSSVRSWMHAIAWHTYVDWVRQDHRAESHPDVWWESFPANQCDPADEVLNRDLVGAVYSAVDRLETDLRLTVQLHYYQGLSLAETAAALDIAVATVKHRLQRALSVLQKKLREEASPPARASARHLS
jgi:RNA polymerase sigma-70 factor (ECF subfamily)